MSDFSDEAIAREALRLFNVPKHAQLRELERSLRTLRNALMMQAEPASSTGPAEPASSTGPAEPASSSPPPGPAPLPVVYPCVWCGGVLAVSMHTASDDVEGVSVSHASPVCKKWMGFFDELLETLERRAPRGRFTGPTPEASRRPDTRTASHPPGAKR